MPDNPDLPGWPENSAFLPMTCGEHARTIATLLRGPVRAEAERLLADGFVVTAPEVLDRAANIFEVISKKPANDHPRQMIQGKAALDLIQSFAQTLYGFEREIDMTAFSAWADWSETMKDADAIHAVWSLLNISQANNDLALALITADIERAHDEFGRSR